MYPPAAILRGLRKRRDPADTTRPAQTPRPTPSAILRGQRKNTKSPDFAGCQICGCHYVRGFAAYGHERGGRGVVAQARNVVVHVATDVDVYVVSCMG